MKKLVLPLFFFLTTLQVMAIGKFHAIIFADTNDDRLGEGFYANISIICDELGIISAALDMENSFEPQIYQQFECNPEKLREVIRNLKCGSDDIVTFFYFGHGTRSSKDKSDFPQMCIGNDESKWIPLEDVKRALEKKGGRFTLVVGDCCNNVPDGDPVKPKFGVLNAAGNSTISSTQTAAMKRLFLEHKGSLMISGSRKGEYSIYLNGKTGGGYLTMAFCSVLEYYTQKYSTPNWDNILNDMQELVVQITTDIKRQRPDLNIQHPQWKNELNSLKVNTNNNNNINNNNNNIPRQEPKDLLGALVDIAKESNGVSYRIKRRQDVIKTYFSPDAIVEVVGRNGTTSLSEETASDFVNRISTTFKLKNFSIHEQRKDNNGKVTYLKLHEIYSE